MNAENISMGWIFPNFLVSIQRCHPSMMMMNATSVVTSFELLLLLLKLHCTEKERTDGMYSIETIES
jgi:hypothetical protein